MQSKGKTGRADVALIMINKLYGIKRELKNVGNEERFNGSRQRSLSILGLLKGRLYKTQVQVTPQSMLGKVVRYMANNRCMKGIALIRYWSH